MQQKEVLDLIETIVKPLRARIAHLEKENQRMKAQLAGQTAPKHEYLRQRSSSKDQRPASKKKEELEVQSPSPAGKKKEESNEKPTWGYARGGKPEAQMKSPPPKDKAPPIPNSPRGVPRNASKEKLQSQKRHGEKTADKKIAGGKKVDLSSLPPASNPEHAPPSDTNSIHQ